VLQGDDHVFLVLAIAQGPGRGLEAVVAASDAVSGVLA
jgi:hypothetical protein